jgi:hypothetical protein
MDPRQFAGSSTGHVRRIGSGEVAYWAFIPNPLPPKLTLDTELVNVLDEATLALGRLDGIGSQLSNPYLLIRPFTHREAILSSRIEGTQAELTDLLLFQLDTESGPSNAPATASVFLRTGRPRRTRTAGLRQPLRVACTGAAGVRDRRRLPRVRWRGCVTSAAYLTTAAVERGSMTAG